MLFLVVKSMAIIVAYFGFSYVIIIIFFNVTFKRSF